MGAVGTRRPPSLCAAQRQAHPRGPAHKLKGLYPFVRMGVVGGVVGVVNGLITGHAQQRLLDQPMFASAPDVVGRWMTRFGLFGFGP